MSVKTGAVRGTPKIDKLLAMDVDSIRTYGTAMLASVTGGQASAGPVPDEVAEAGGEAREAIEERKEEIPTMPIRNGIAPNANSKDRERAMQVYRVRETEKAREMATLAFAKEEALERNEVAEADGEEYFDDYLKEITEQLVEGAWLTCTMATNEPIYIKRLDREYKFTGEFGRTETQLTNVPDVGNDGKADYATVSVTECCVGEKGNIVPFRNCKLTNASVDRENQAIAKHGEYKDYGTCYALMDLCEEWVNVKEGVEYYGTPEKGFEKCINMLSHLGCYQGGMIFPLTSGQGEALYGIFEIQEGLKIDERALKKIQSYYNNEVSIKEVVDSGGMSIFAFEGLGHYEGTGDDNYYKNGRFGAMMVVIHGNKISYVTYNASTLPSNPDNIGNNAVVAEGIYKLSGKKHHGKYPAFQLLEYESEDNTKIPATYKGDPKNIDATYINIHTAPNHAASTWSAGCQIIMTKDYMDFLVATGCVDGNDKLVQFLDGMEIESSDEWYGNASFKISYETNLYGYETLLSKLNYKHKQAPLDNKLYILDKEYMPTEQIELFYD